MTFLYGCVAYEQKILAEYCAAQGNVPKIAREVLKKGKYNNQRLALEQDSYVFSMISENTHLTYVVLSNKNVQANVRFYAIEQIKIKFNQDYSSPSSIAPESKSGEFGPKIKKILEDLENPQAAKIATINSNIQNAAQVMTENLEMALARGEKLDVLEQKAEGIKENAAAFKKNSNKLKTNMCLEKWKWYLIGAAVVVVIIIIIVVACTVG